MQNVASSRVGNLLRKNGALPGRSGEVNDYANCCKLHYLKRISHDPFQSLLVDFSLNGIFMIRSSK